MNKKIVILIFLLISNVTAYGAEYSNYEDSSVSIIVEKRTNVVGADTFVLKLKTKECILIPNEDFCFNLDSNERFSRALGCGFQNYDCGIAILSCQGTVYRFLPKDTVITYEYISPKGRRPDYFYFDVLYISATTDLFAERRKNIVLSLSKQAGIYITPEDESVLVTHARSTVWW